MDWYGSNKIFPNENYPPTLKVTLTLTDGGGGAISVVGQFFGYQLIYHQRSLRDVTLENVTLLSLLIVEKIFLMNMIFDSMINFSKD